MEYVEAVSEGEWNTPLTEMCSEETTFLAQLLGNHSLPDEEPSSSNFAVSSTFWPSCDSKFSTDECPLYASDKTNNSVYDFSQGSCSSGGSSILFPFTHNANYSSGVSYQFLESDDNLMSTDYCMVGANNNSLQSHIFTTNVMEGDDFLNLDVSNESSESNGKIGSVLHGKNLQRGKEVAMAMPEQPKEDRFNSPSESKKRSCSPGELQKDERNMKLRKCSGSKDNNDDAVDHKQCLSMEDDSNAPREMKGTPFSSSAKGGKARTSRGSATDPQSLYARKRRERINERLKILQNLVPNGTKVDISTMLEEAVQYVKFLQLQIKMLSSDELWMYAPIAYNGMDIGGLI